MRKLTLIEILTATAVMIGLVSFIAACVATALYDNSTLWRMLNILTAQRVYIINN